nr:HipA domain-containing protein [Adlercreutzia sp. JBNU-10]
MGGGASWSTGSSGGARPKILTAIDGEEWIVKFPSSHDGEGIGAHEHRVAQAARSCGIMMPETRLLPSRRCPGYFAVRRFDRPGGGEKVHMASAGALLETSHRIPNLDYDLLLKLTLRLTDDMAQVEALFRIMALNVCIGNRDDHARNFSFLYDERAGQWLLSPAYDLTSNPGMNGEHATTVNGRGRGITAEDVVAVGERAGISGRRARSIEREVRDVAGDAGLLVEDEAAS